jgi:Ni,Fe-hydrogenase III small subunit
MAFNLNRITIPEKDDNMNAAGRPVITGVAVDQFAIKAICPANAIAVNPVRIDLAKCVFCKACSDAFPDKIKFNPDSWLASNVRDRLVVLEREDSPVLVETDFVRKEVKDFAAPIVKLKLVTDDLTESPLLKVDNESHNIVFVESANDAHGIVITAGFINMETIFRDYNLLKEPKIIVVAGRAALISYDTMITASDWPAQFKVDLFIPGEPLHPTVFANGILALTKSKN